MRTINANATTIQFYTDRAVDIPDDIPNDNITAWVIRNDVLDTFLGDTVTALCDNIQDFRAECNGDIELHIEERGAAVFIHAVDENSEVHNITPVPTKVIDMLNTMSQNIASVETALGSYDNHLNDSAGAND